MAERLAGRGEADPGGLLLQQAVGAIGLQETGLLIVGMAVYHAVNPGEGP